MVYSSLFLLAKFIDNESCRGQRGAMILFMMIIYAQKRCTDTKFVVAKASLQSRVYHKKDLRVTDHHQ
jgi:hypothetical protein